MPPLNFISSGRSVRKRLPLEKFVDYTHCCESSISFAVFSRHFKNVHSRNCSWILQESKDERRAMLDEKL